MVVGDERDVEIARLRAQVDTLTALITKQTLLLEQFAERDTENERLRGLVEKLTATVTEQTAAIEAFQHSQNKRKRKEFGKKSERMPTIREELEARAAAARAETEKKQKDKPRRAARPEPTVAVEKPVALAPNGCTCSSCGQQATVILPAIVGRRLIEYRPPEFVFEQPMLERRTCPCGQLTQVADEPERIGERSPFGPNLVANLVVSKLIDAIPQYRLSRMLARSGLRLSRQTMNDLFHRAADLTHILAARVMRLIAEQAVVEADETTQRSQDLPGLNYLWAFRAKLLSGQALVAYRFSSSRAAKVPMSILGPPDSPRSRYLLTDMYSGYGPAARASRRRRAGCWAHVRRHFFELKESHPVVGEVLGLILDLYQVEYDAARDGVVGTKDHLRLRRERSLPVAMAIRLWARHHAKTTAPRSPFGKALAYVLGNMAALTRFLRDPRLALDNNAIENAMRPPAMGRKNWLFVGDEECGERHAWLLTLLMSAIQCGHNPETYLADILTRLGKTRQQDLDELLPHRWRPPTPA